MDERFWDRMASQYDEEIFSVLQSDRQGVLANRIKKYTPDDAVVCDFGCGVGRFVPLLAQQASRVIAVDFSKRSLAVAQKNHGDLTNVEFQWRDLTRGLPRIARADLGLSVNVLIMPQHDRRRAILENLRRNIRPGGYLLLVVPSIEATLLTYSRLIEWHVRDGDGHRKAVNAARRAAREEVVSLAEGIFRIRDTPTKHYLREEALVMLDEHQFEPVETQKIEYDWKEDLDGAPRWMTDPYPWDWLLVARRR